MIRKLALFFCLFLFIASAGATVVDRNTATILNTLQWLHKVAGRQVKLNQAQLKKYFTSDASLTANGKILASGIPALYKHFHSLYKAVKYDQRKVFKTLQSGSKVVVYYSLIFSPNTALALNHSPTKAYVMAIYSVRDGKISSWTEVTHQHNHVFNY